MLRLNIKALRKFMGWVFAVTSLVSIWMASRLILYQIHRHYTFRRLSILLLVLLLDVIFPVLAVIWGVAWWKLRNENPSTKGWGIAASLAYILFFLMGGYHCWRSLPGPSCVVLAVGVTGLVAFSRRNEIQSKTNGIEPESDPS
jgi:hypothetical protein